MGVLINAVLLSQINAQHMAKFEKLLNDTLSPVLVPARSDAPLEMESVLESFLRSLDGSADLIAMFCKEKIFSVTDALELTAVELKAMGMPLGDAKKLHTAMQSHLADEFVDGALSNSQKST